MMDLFDMLGRSLNDLIQSSDNNKVSHAATQMFASGGFASDDREPSYIPSIKQTIASDNKSSDVSSPDFNIFGGRETNYYSSPEGLTQRIAGGWGHFFQGPQPNTGGTNSPMQKPGKSKPTESTNPTDFYARWYNRMREFAQAEEVANRGQSQVRTR